MDVYQLTADDLKTLTAYLDGLFFSGLLGALIAYDILKAILRWLSWVVSPRAIIKRIFTRIRGRRYDLSADES